MKLITKKSKAILSTCIAISIAGGAVFANVTNEANGTIGSHTNSTIRYKSSKWSVRWHNRSQCYDYQWTKCPRCIL